MDKEIYGAIFLGIVILIILGGIMLGLNGAWQDSKVNSCFEATDNYEWCFEQIYKK